MLRGARRWASGVHPEGDQPVLDALPEDLPRQAVGVCATRTLVVPDAREVVLILRAARHHPQRRVDVRGIALVDIEEAALVAAELLTGCATPEDLERRRRNGELLR